MRGRILTYDNLTVMQLNLGTCSQPIPQQPRPHHGRLIDDIENILKFGTDYSYKELSANLEAFGGAQSWIDDGRISST